jgi:hypothetical protein
VFSDSSFDLLASYQLGSQEIPTAITSMSFGNGSAADKPDAAAAGAAAGGGSSSEDSPAYYIVGTAVIKPIVSVRATHAAAGMRHSTSSIPASRCTAA